VGDRAKLNAASPKMEKALRRETISVSFLSVTFNLPTDCLDYGCNDVPLQPIVVATIVATAHFIPSLSGLTFNEVNEI
jgi:hypothetical protein